MERNSRSADFQRGGRYKRKQKSEWSQILLFYVLPFFIFNGILFYCVTNRPNVEVELKDTNDYVVTEAVVTVKSWFPTKTITFSMDGETLKAEKGKKRTYTIPITKNGVIETYVENINGMSVTQFEHVNILDDNIPTMKDARIADGIVTLTLTDSQSGVDFDSIYALDSTGRRLQPLTVDRATNTLSFEMDPAGLHVYASDKAGNEAQGTYTSHKEGSEETLTGSLEDPDGGPSEEQTESEVTIE